MKSLPDPLYMTHNGTAYVGDAIELLQGLADGSVDLVLTSPPFALQRQKNTAMLIKISMLTGYYRSLSR